MIESSLLPDAHHFEHEAMKTTFSLRILGGSAETARGMALECFALIDSIENRLSRYVDGSDVSQINGMQAGETLYLSEPCHECMRIALDVYARTGGLFDITQGRRIEHRKSEEDGPPPPIGGQLTLALTFFAAAQGPGTENLIRLAGAEFLIGLGLLAFWWPVRS